MSDLYEQLGVSRNASVEDIRRAYKEAARTHHPDRGGDTEKFKKIQEAHEVLCDENRRKMYDMTGSTQETPHGPGMGGMAAGGIPFSFMGGMGGPFGMPGMSFDMSDIFGNMFGGGPGGRRGRNGGKAPPKFTDINLELRDFYVGKDIKLKFNQARRCGGCSGSGAEATESCGTCGGSGVRMMSRQIGPGMIAQTRAACDACNGEGKRIMRTCRECHGKRFVEKEKTLDIRITPGMREGEQLTFAGECSDTLEYETPGDVILNIRRVGGDDYEWKGDDLWTQRKITYAESVLGFKLTFDDHPSGSKPTFIWRGGPLINGAVVQMTGMGMKNKTGGVGNLFVRIAIEAPEVKAWSSEDAAKLRSVLGGPSASLEDAGLPEFVVHSSSA
jgi:DnaJ-class molecular chaperone